jgi:hypothetical protein
VIGAGAVAVLYYFWTKVKSTQTVQVPGVGTMTWPQYDAEPTNNPGAAADVGIVVSGNAGWTGLGTSDPTLPPTPTGF